MVEMLELSSTEAVLYKEMSPQSLRSFLPCFAIASLYHSIVAFVSSCFAIMSLKIASVCLFQAILIRAQVLNNAVVAHVAAAAAAPGGCSKDSIIHKSQTLS